MIAIRPYPAYADGIPNGGMTKGYARSDNGDFLHAVEAVRSTSATRRTRRFGPEMPETAAGPARPLVEIIPPGENLGNGLDHAPATVAMPASLAPPPRGTPAAAYVRAFHLQSCGDGPARGTIFNLRV